MQAHLVPFSHGLECTERINAKIRVIFVGRVGNETMHMDLAYRISSSNRARFTTKSVVVSTIMCGGEVTAYLVE